MSSGIRVSTWISPELVREILLWLPVKSLLRFRSVRKSLCTEIDSSDFVKAHLKKSIESKTRLKLIIHPVHKPRLSTGFYAADFDEDLGEAVVLNNPFKSLENEVLLVLGTCNGLILFYVATEFVYYNSGSIVATLFKLLLWNPFTRRYKKLLSPSFSRKFWITASGLGYDSESDDYKVVLIVKSHLRISVVRMLVYSLRSDSWRTIQHEFPPSIYDDVSIRGRLVDGSLHWLCRSEEGYKMLGFDLSKEVLFELPFVCEPDSHDFHMVLVSFDGNMYAIKLYHYNSSKPPGIFLWVSDKSAERSAAGCWKKAFEMDKYCWPFGLLCSKNGNGDVLLVSKGELISWYDLKGKVEESVRIQGLPDADSYKCNVCLESLVSLGNNSVYDGE